VFVFVFFALGTALASQDVIYKEARPPKKIFKEDKEAEKPNALGGKKKQVSFIYDPTWRRRRRENRGHIWRP
jgi:hypothetical protein